MSDSMQGKRHDADPNNPTQAYPRLRSGEYGKDADGLWYCVPPGKDPFGWLGTLGDGQGNKGHKVTEHEDGTITASPSILITTHEGTWHGYLEKGVWREV